MMSLSVLLAFIAFLGSAFLIVGCATSSWVVWEAGINSQIVLEYGKIGCWEFCIKDTSTGDKDTAVWVCDDAWNKINVLDTEDAEIKFNVIIGFACMAAICSSLGAILILGHALNRHDQKWLAVCLHGWGAVCGFIAVMVFAAFRSDFNNITDTEKTVTYAGLGFSFFLEMVGSVQCMMSACVTQLKKPDDPMDSQR